MTSAIAAAAAVARGEVSPVTLVERALERVAALDVEVGAFVHVAAERALEEAAALASEVRQGQVRGPLHGVPVAVKDVFDVAGETTTAGSLLPLGPRAAWDAEAVRRLRAAGAIVLGRTRTHEFAWGMTTQHPILGGTRNPHDRSRVPGGSSGGSAAAVAAGIVPLALGTDTAGSLRLPAAWCGVVGHRPTWGLTPSAGTVPLAPSLDCVGGLTADVADARLALAVLANRPVAPVRRDAMGLRVGVLVHSSFPRVAGAAQARIRDALQRLEGGGAAVLEVTAPPPSEVLAVLAAVQGGEALDGHRSTGRWPAYADLYGSDVADRLRQAETLDRTPAGRRDALQELVAEAFRQVDVLVSPVAATGPSFVNEPDRVRVEGESVDLRATVLAFTALASLCGLPACSAPGGIDGDGLPVGIQVTGASGADDLVLDVAELLHRAV